MTTRPSTDPSTDPVTALVSADLLHEVLEANLVIPREGLATLTWGNVSGLDRERGIYVIKPSGVPYPELSVEHLVAVDVETGAVVGGHLRPSTDSETHRLLYLREPDLGGVAHTHSTHAVAWAQAGRDVPVLGTTHADTFNGPVPVTRHLTAQECASDYELNTGRVIAELLDAAGGSGGSALDVPGALVAGHGPFTWGRSAAKAVEHSVVLEAVAEMALITMAINPAAASPAHLYERHFTRKHGPGAYYGNPDRAVPAGR